MPLRSLCVPRQLIKASPWQRRLYFKETICSQQTSHSSRAWPAIKWELAGTAPMGRRPPGTDPKTAARGGGRASRSQNCTAPKVRFVLKQSHSMRISLLPSLNCHVEIGSIKPLWAAASALCITANFHPIIIIIPPASAVNKIRGSFWVSCWSRTGANRCPELHRQAQHCCVPLRLGTPFWCDRQGG